VVDDVNVIPVNPGYPRFDNVTAIGSFRYNTIDDRGGVSWKRPLKMKSLYATVDAPAVRITVSPFVEPGVRNPVTDSSIVTVGVPLPVKNER
jgi:hypothetical protein